VRVKETVDIKASPEAVYDLIADPERLEEWVTIHDDLLESSGGGLEKGSQLTQCLRLAGQRFKVRWKVVESDRPHRLVWEGRGPMRSKAKVINSLEPSDRGTRFSYTNEYDLPGGPLGKMAGPMVRRVTTGELQRSLEQLRKLVE
jgi:carbon monoxide dehydrogenase subunit G